MGQKVNPKGLRTGIRKTWTSKWYASKYDFGQKLCEDLEIRKFFEKNYKESGIGDVEIERHSKKIRVVVHTSRVGVIVGRQGSGIEEVVAKLEKHFKHSFEVEVLEIRKPDIDANIVAHNIARQLEKRMPFRRVAKQAIQKTMEAKARGIKIVLSGRLAGAEIARSELFIEGKIPLHTFRADISYCAERAETIYGTIGVKVYIYKKDIFSRKKKDIVKTEEVVA